MVVVHAIFIVTNIEFSRLIGDYLSAKFELNIYIILPKGVNSFWLPKVFNIPLKFKISTPNK